MTLSVIPLWNSLDGSRTGPLNYPPARSDADAERLIQRGFDEARRARGTDPRVIVMDDVTWTTVKTFREGDEITMEMTGKIAIEAYAMIEAVRSAAKAAGAKDVDPVALIKSLHEQGIELNSSPVATARAAE